MHHIAVMNAAAPTISLGTIYLSDAFLSKEIHITALNPST
jgi:hypothetical protein